MPNLYHITPKEFEIIDRIEVDDRSIRYELQPVNIPSSCPQCHCSDIIQHGTNTRKARDLSEFGKMVGLVINGHRYRCKNCGKTFVDQYETIDADAKITKRMRDYIREQALNVPFSHIKRELDISVPTIEKIFGEYTAEMEKNRKLIAPRILGMDETQLNSVYRGMFVDVENRRIIDMTEDRKLSTIRSWLQQLPEKERIECCTIDMWGPYKDAIEYEIPDSNIIIDKFHVIKHLNESLETIRKAYAAKLTDKERRHIKGNRWLMLKNSEELDFMSQCKLKDILHSFPQFEEPHAIKENFREIYMAGSRSEAEKAFEKWKETITDYPEFVEFAETVDRWNTEIFNYFDNKYTNSVTESLNRVSKEISAQGRGYNFKVLRAKILYRTPASKPAKFSYYEEKSDFSKGNTGIAVYDAHKFFVDNPKSNIMISSGTDIDELHSFMQKERLFAYMEHLNKNCIFKAKKDPIATI